MVDFPHSLNLSLNQAVLAQWYAFYQTVYLCVLFNTVYIRNISYLILWLCPVPSLAFAAKLPFCKLKQPYYSAVSQATAKNTKLKKRQKSAICRSPELASLKQSVFLSFHVFLVFVCFFVFFCCKLFSFLLTADLVTLETPVRLRIIHVCKIATLYIRPGPKIMFSMILCSYYFGFWSSFDVKKPFLKDVLIK